MLVLGMYVIEGFCIYIMDWMDDDFRLGFGVYGCDFMCGV